MSKRLGDLATAFTEIVENFNVGGNMKKVRDLFHDFFAKHFIILDVNLETSSSRNEEEDNYDWWFWY